MHKIIHIDDSLWMILFSCVFMSHFQTAIPASAFYVQNGEHEVCRNRIYRGTQEYGSKAIYV